MSEFTVISENVKAIKVEHILENGSWKVDDKTYHVGWCYVKNSENKLYDTCHIPNETEVEGSIIEIQRSMTNGDGPMHKWKEIVFQPNDGQFTSIQTEQWRDKFRNKMFSKSN